MANTTVKCPHCNKTFQVETASGKTALVRTFGREYFKAHPQATLDAAVWAFYEAHPEAKGVVATATVHTQLRTVR